MTTVCVHNYLHVEMPADWGSLTMRVTPERVVGGGWSTRRPIRAHDKVQEFLELVYTFSFAHCHKPVMREMIDVVVWPLVRFQVHLDMTPLRLNGVGVIPLFTDKSNGVINGLVRVTECRDFGTQTSNH